MACRRRVTPKSPVRDLFGITNVRRYTCTPRDEAEEGCVSDARVFATRADLAIPLPPRGSGGRVGLEHCITHMNRPFSSGVTGPCAGCGKVGSRSWRVFWEAPPRALLLVLERFDDPHGQKLNTPVRVPLAIDSLRARGVLLEGAEDAAYELSAVTLHSGSRFGGHYKAVVRAPGGGGGWLECDDSSVAPCPGFPQLMETGTWGSFTVTTALYSKRAPAAAHTR
jgi:ubiquitin C-terminal hydrolase